MLQKEMLENLERKENHFIKKHQGKIFNLSFFSEFCLFYSQLSYSRATKLRKKKQE